MAESVLKIAQDGREMQVQLVALGEGISNLVALLNVIVQELEARRQEIFEERVNRGPAPAAAPSD
jgi:hypothetical protein